MSKTGKHGHAKFTFNLKYPFTNQTSQEMHPGHTHLTRPDVRKYEWFVNAYDRETGDIDAFNEKNETVEAKIHPSFDNDNFPKMGEQFMELYDQFEEEGDFDIIINVTEGPVYVKKKEKHYYVLQVTEFKRKEHEEN